MSAPATTTVYAYFYEGDGSVPACGRSFAMVLVAANTGNDAFSNQPFWSSASDSTGYSSVTAITGGTYSASLDGVNWSANFAVSGTTFHLAEILGALVFPPCSI